MSQKSAAAPVKISTLSIPVGDGVKLAAKLWLPRVVPAPTLIEFSCLTSSREDAIHSVLAKDGYAVLRIDPRGLGDSAGVFTGGFNRQDETDALQAMNFIAEQKWCDGKLGLFGFSASGTAALQIARRQPVGLAAIIAIAATDDPYEDGGAYQGGVAQTALLASAAWQLAKVAAQKNAKANLKHLRFMATDWLQHPARDAEWISQTASEDLGLITAPTLLVAGWQDAASRAVPRMMMSLRSPCKAVIGGWGHEWPQESSTGIDFSVEMLRWFDQHLKGKATGVMQENAFRYFMNDAGHSSGRWLGDMMWGAGASVTQHLYLSAHGLSTTKGEVKALQFSSPLTCGFGVASMQADGAARDDNASLTFDSAPVAADLDIVGAPTVSLDLSADGAVAQVLVRLSAISESGAIVPLASHMLNLTQRVSRGQPSALEPSRKYLVNVQLADMAARVSKGQRLRVSIVTSNFPQSWPAPSRISLDVQSGNSSLSLPLRQDRGMEKLITFASLAKAPVAEHVKRVFSLDPVTGAARLISGESVFTIKPDEPSSAKQVVEASATAGKVRSHVQATMTATAKHWVVSAKLEAFEGKKKIFTKEFSEKVARKLV